MSYFWDGNGDLEQSYARILKLPEGQPAWNVYFAFNRGGEWNTESPVPDYWMHQLHGQPPERSYLSQTKFEQPEEKG